MDKFLLSKVGGSENHPVELKIIHSFKRMRHFQPFEAIVSAMRDSTILRLTDDDTCVQRIEPLPESLSNGPVEVFEDRAMPRSIYAKGFGEEMPSTQFDIEAFFAPYGPTNAIRLRRSDTKIFKGSVFVEFASEELQKNFLEMDPKPKYMGKDLQIMSKKAYCDGKVEDIKSGKIIPNERKYKAKDSQYNGRDKRKRDDEDDRDWRERREDDRRNGFRDDRRGGRNRRGSPDYQRGGKSHRGERDYR
jgi:lupus La protein